MALSFRRKASKAQRARGVVTTIAAFRLFGLRRIVAVAGAGALVATTLLIAKRRSPSAPAPVPGAPPTEASAPTPPQNGTTASLADAAEQARAAAASLAPQGGGAA